MGLGNYSMSLKNGEKMTTYCLEEHKHLEERLVQLGQEIPGPMSSFAHLHRKAKELFND